MTTKNSTFDTISNLIQKNTYNNTGSSSKISNNNNGIEEKAKRSGELGKNQFLKLLVAQMKNQNPLQPQANGDFIAQLAQFSTVEGIENLNKSVKSIIEGNKSSQALQGAALVGKKVMISSDKAQVDTTESLRGSVAVPSPSADVWVNIYDSAGKQINRLNLGQQPAGMISFSWNGTDLAGKKLSTDVYRFEAQAILKGANTALSTDLPAKVESVTLGKNGSEMILKLAGIGQVPISKVQAVGQ